MKNIDFDESLVLREYARIAGEKGIIKEAEDGARVPKGPVPTAPTAKDTRTIPPTQPQTAEDHLNILFRGYPNVGVVYSGKNPKNYQAFIEEISMPDFFQALNALWTTSKQPEHKQTLQPLVKTLKQRLLQYISQLSAAIKKQRNQYKRQGYATLDHDKKLKNLNNAYKGLSARKASAEPALSKRAESEGVLKMAKDDKGKVYDVTGETGEQLVEKAHPGGGTKTELTHSKTDENLVETIVEQQERDVEVARSKPKGTYAMLADLHDELHKMGYEDHLEPLINAMARLKIANSK